MGNRQAIMGRSSDVLATVEEVALALRGLPPSDLLRLEQYAKIRTMGLGWLAWDDLLQETVMRALSGERRWPKHVPFVVFMRETLRSLAHEEVRRRIEGPVTTAADFEVGGDGGWSSLIEQHPDGSTGPVDRIAADQALDAIFNQFSDDAEVKALLMGLTRGLTPDECCTESKITRTQFESAQKRLRRYINGLRSKGVSNG